jgi:hypothetical protein
MNTEQTNELRKLAEAALWTGRWYDGGCETLMGTYGDDSENAEEHGEVVHPVPLGIVPFLAAVQPAAILALIAEIDSLRDEVNGLTGELGRERKRLDWALKHDSFYDHTTGVFFCDPAFKILNPQVRVETDDPRAAIDSLMGQS